MGKDVMSEATHAVICLSGGLDSTSLLLHQLARRRKVFGLSFDYGQKHRIELDRLRGNLDYLQKHDLSIDWRLVDLRSLTALLHSSLTDPNWEVPEGHYEQENMKQTVVPNRNAIFASIAFAHALSIANRESTEVQLSLGVHRGDHVIYPDCRPEFYRAIYQAFLVGNWDAQRVGLYLPYQNLTKAQILEDAIHSIGCLNLDFSTVFRNTCTGYLPDPQGRSLAFTGADVERILAFHELGIEDPLAYREPWSEVVRKAVALQRQPAAPGSEGSSRT
jgi:7-cyano-7-deazaguanine synthase